MKTERIPQRYVHKHGTVYQKGKYHANFGSDSMLQLLFSQQNERFNAKNQPAGDGCLLETDISFTAQVQ